MSPSGISSNHVTKRGGGACGRFLALLLLPGIAVAGPSLTTEEALRLAFPDCGIERKTYFLTEEQMEESRKLAGVEIPSAMVTAYKGVKDGFLAGTAYFDVHRVRTLPETIMVVVTPENTVRRVEVLSFSEPPEYMAPRKWYEIFSGQTLTEGLTLKKKIPSITGATLTSRATANAVRRVLALHQVLNESQPPALKPAPASLPAATLSPQRTQP